MHHRHPLTAAAASTGRWAQRLARWLAGHRASRRTQDTHFALHALDSRTLRDLGIDRSEIASFAGESAGHLRATRIRILQCIAPL